MVQSLLPTYVKNADTLINKLKIAFPHRIPFGTKLFSVDAVGMYQNIDTDHGMKVIDKFFTKFKDEIPAEVPTVFIRESLHIIMSQNVFQFGDTFWW